MKKVVITILLASVHLLATANQEIQQLYEEGRIWLEQGELDSAEKVLMTVVELNDMHAPAYYLLSRIYLSRYDVDKTREYLNKAINSDKLNQEYRDEFERLNQIAIALGSAKRSLDGGNIDEAIVKYEKLIEEHADFAPAALYYMGRASSRAGEISEAADYFRRALELDPKYELANRALETLAAQLYNEGNQALRRGDYEESIDQYLKVLQLDPNHYRAHFQLGYVSTKLGEYDDAIARYKKAVEIEPSFAKGWFALGLAYQRNNDFYTALESLDAAVAADPTYAKAYSQKGTIYIKLGELSAAESAFSQAIQADSTYVKAYENLGKIYVDQERNDAAVNVLATATALDARSYTAWARLASAYHGLGQCEQAKEAARKAVDLKPNYAPAMFYLGVAEACLGNKTAALNWLEKARRDRSLRKAAEYEIDRIKNPEKYSSD